MITSGQIVPEESGECWMGHVSVTSQWRHFDQARDTLWLYFTSLRMHNILNMVDVVYN